MLDGLVERVEVVERDSFKAVVVVVVVRVVVAVGLEVSFWGNNKRVEMLLFPDNVVVEGEDENVSFAFEILEREVCLLKGNDDKEADDDEEDEE